jgi:acyl-CoA thioesterase I
MKKIYMLWLIAIISCSSESKIQKNEPIPVVTTKEYKYLALGDSYTIGESVCETCRFPEQLKSGLKNAFPNDKFSLQVIAQTGWTTTNLISNINTILPSSNFDLVSLLIGVNNQYQNKAFSVYEDEFPALVNRAIGFAKGDKSNVIVVSIPDYAYTPFGQGAVNISTAIDKYNDFAKQYCIQNNIKFIDITDITRQGLTNTNLVASDGLHPSELAYAKFVERILPQAIIVLRN